MNVYKNIMRAIFILASCNSIVFAGVIVGGTRVIYDGTKKETSISVNNPDSAPYLIQSWIETEDQRRGKVPFILTPPLYRLDNGQQNVMRIVRTGELPEDKESMFWLNIKSIPSSSPSENTLQIAVKTRIKLFYRPTALKNISPDSIPAGLRWQRSGNQFSVTNPSAFYINFSSLKVDGKEVSEATYIAPGKTMTYPLPPGAGAGMVTFTQINDYGGVEAERKAKL